MRKLCNIFLLVTSICYSQNTQLQFEKRMRGSLELWTKSKSVFDFIKIDTIPIYEIEFFTYDSLNDHSKCYNLNFFSLKLDSTGIQNTLTNYSYLKLGLIYESLRPNSVLNPNNSKNYELESLIIRKTDEFCYKLNNKEYYKIFKSKAIISTYHCSSKQWYKFYYPFRQKRHKEFYYLEINKVLERNEITDNIFLKNKRVKFTCNQSMY